VPGFYLCGFEQSWNVLLWAMENCSCLGTVAVVSGILHGWMGLGTN
jgi:hypothetical protein